ncbi:MAG TPA: hypothetical protein VKB12_19190 [Pyrinomonadaceae bacterium]|nr:hypothetical protein [Pyrinomonadaceae bacterium]
MRFEIRTLSRAISTLALLLVLVFGASLDVAAQGNSRWGRSHNRGRHLGWTRGRRVGQQRNSNWLRWRRREARRDRRDDRRDWRRDRREDRRDRRDDRRNNWRNR